MFILLLLLHAFLVLIFTAPSKHKNMVMKINNESATSLCQCFKQTTQTTLLLIMTHYMNSSDLPIYDFMISSSFSIICSDLISFY